MGEQESSAAKWGGWLWILILVAIVLSVAVLVALFPRSLAYRAPAPTAVPWTKAPGLYVIPTATPIPPVTATPPFTPEPTPAPR